MKPLALLAVLLLAALATPRAAPDYSIEPIPAGRPYRGIGPGQLGAPHVRGALVSGNGSQYGFSFEGSLVPAPTTGGAPQPRAEAPVPSPSGDLGTAISSGWASWYPARGDVASVPWWQPGQRPVWAAVNRYADGRAYSVTVLIVGWCGCLQGQPGERAIDLSDDAFAQLAPLSAGLIQVTIEVPTQGPVLPATDGGTP